MFKTLNFNKFIEYLDSNKPRYEVEKEASNYLIEGINRTEEYALQSEEEIFKNEGNIAIALRNFLEIFLIDFIPKRIELNPQFNDFDYDKYYKLGSSNERIIELDREWNIINKDIKDALHFIKNIANNASHNNKNKFVEINKSKIVMCLDYIYNILYWFYDLNSKKDFVSNRYYKPNEKEPTANIKIKQTFSHEPYKTIVINDDKILNVLFDEGKKFFIPIYQRNFSWTKSEIDELFLDLEKRIIDQKNHFFGLVTLSNTNNFKKIGSKKINLLKIVDGQQRFTTIALFVKALYIHYLRALKNNIIKIDSKLAKFINNKNLPIDRFDDEISIKIFELIWKNEKFSKFEENEFKNNNLFEIYKYLFKKIADFKKVKNEYETVIGNLDKLYWALKKLVIGINWTKDYDEFELFESINSKGVPLTNFNIFKNYIISLASNKDYEYENEVGEIGLIFNDQSREISELFDKYIINKINNWLKKNSTKDFEKITNSFFNSYINFYSNNKPNEKRLFSQFKSIFVEQLKQKFGKIDNFSFKEFEKILVDLSVFLNIYLFLNVGTYSIWKQSPALSEFYKYFHTLAGTSFINILVPYLISEENVVFTENGSIVRIKNPKEFQEILKFLEIWRIRLGVVNSKLNYAVKIFPFSKKFNQILDKNKGNGILNNSFLDLLKSTIADEDNFLKFPDDKKFYNTLANEPIYNQQILKDVILKIVQSEDKFINETNYSKYEMYPIIEKDLKKRSEKWNNFLQGFDNLKEESYFKLGNYFSHKNNKEIKKNEKEDFNNLLLNIQEDNITINKNGFFEILSISNLNSYYGKDINEYFLARSKYLAQKALEIFNIN
ncbi:/ / hypothetical protein / 7491:9992 Forward [Candidatus Hepatoplasma crinochetorum]|uniref:GmrSD restriction endonucleases N-terminal domain-containing protein n=1 Tax=Candidatus Hepatoplasma crinochetorum TaxID=295596 RepID=A0A0G7ZNA1_9MOLU|nr:/ / hypothetical protein / 7491:9992 Forward [Candidatus Hepatoplasma crinochetorum]